MTDLLFLFLYFYKEFLDYWLWNTRFASYYALEVAYVSGLFKRDHLDWN